MKKENFKQLLKKGVSLSMAAVMSLSALYAVPAVVKDYIPSVAVVADAASAVKLSSCSVSVAKAYYTGKALKPAVVVKRGKTTYKNGKDYTVSYKNNTKLGTATATVTAKKGGKLSGSKTVKFNIVLGKTSLSSSSSASSIKLSWKAVKGATGYEVYSYNASKKKYTKLTTAKSTSYTVSKLKSSTAYSYKVRAIAKVSKKTYTGEYTALYTTITTPAAVTGVKLSYKTGATTMGVTWKKVAGVTGYVVYNYDVKTKKYTNLGKTTKTSFTVKNIAPSTEYQIVVRAYRTYNKKNYWAPLSSKVMLCTAPNKTASLKAVAGDGQVLLTWAAQKNVSGYTVYQYNTKTKKYEAIKNVAANNCIVAKLKNGTSYKFAVAAYKTASNKKVYRGSSISVSCKPDKNNAFNFYYNGFRSTDFKVVYEVPTMTAMLDDFKDMMEKEPVLTTVVRGNESKLIMDMKIILVGNVKMTIYYNKSSKVGYAYYDMSPLLGGNQRQKITETQAKDNGANETLMRNMFAPKIASGATVKKTTEKVGKTTYTVYTYQAVDNVTVKYYMTGSSLKKVLVSGNGVKQTMNVSSVSFSPSAADAGLPDNFSKKYKAATNLV